MLLLSNLVPRALFPSGVGVATPTPEGKSALGTKLAMITFYVGKMIKTC